MAKPPKQTEKRAKLTPAQQKKLDAANAARRERRAKQQAEAAEALKLEHFMEIAESGSMVASAQQGVPKNMAKARDIIWQTFERLGGVEHLLKFAEKYPKEFYTQIFAKLIPRVSELDVSDNLEDLLAQMGGGKIPGMLEHHPSLEEAEFTEIDPMEITKETLQ